MQLTDYTGNASNSLQNFGMQPAAAADGFSMPNYTTTASAGLPDGGGSSWSWLDSTDKNGMKTQGVLGGVVAGAGAISNAYLGYQGLKEARRSREMQEKYAATNLFNQAQGYNANVRDSGSNNAAINSWSPQQEQQYVNNNQARATV